MGNMGLMGPIRPIKPITPTSPIIPILPLPVFTGPEHLFLDATILDKVPFLPFYQATQQNIALMDKRNSDICDSLVGTLFDLLAIDG